jgi:hypothetical protein
MALRDRIADLQSQRREDAGDHVAHYRDLLLAEVDLAELADLSAIQRRARLERVVGTSCPARARCSASASAPT